MEYSQPTLPLVAGANGSGFGGGEGFMPFLLGALFSGNGGLFGGGRNELNTAINANQSGEIAGLQAGLANVQNTLASNSINGAIDNLGTNLNSGIIRTNDAIDTYAQSVQVGLGNVRTDLANANFNTLNSINGLGRDITASNTQALIQNLNSFNVLGGQVTGATNQLIAGQNNLAHAMQVCCCETKEKIAEDGNLTRALINDLEVKRLTEALNDAKFQNNNQSQTNAIVAAMTQQTNTILAHIPVLLGGASSTVAR